MYIGMGENEGINIEEKDAFEYAAQKCGIKLYVENESAFNESDRKEFQKDFVLWYFSGMWIKE